MCSITPPMTTSPVVVAQGVDVDLDRVLEETVDERGPFGRQTTFAAERPGARELPHRAAQVGVVVDDLHRAAAEHVRRAHEHRVTDLAGDRRPRRSASVAVPPAGCGIPSSLAQRVEALAVLGEVDRLSGDVPSTV